MIKKKTCHVVLGQLQEFIIKNCKKNCSKIHLDERVIFGQKHIESFFKVIMLVYCISFTPMKSFFLKP
jgi:hypothetical protein